MLIHKRHLVKNSYKSICLYTQTCQALTLYIKELAMLFPKTMQKHSGKKLHYIYSISLATQLFQCGYPSLPTRVMLDINFIPSNLSLAVRLSYQHAVLLSETEGNKSRQHLKGATQAGCCSSTVLFSAWRCKADTHGAFE